MKKYETPEVEYIEFYSVEKITNNEGESAPYPSNPGDDIWTPEHEF